MNQQTETKPKPKSGWLNILVDYGPLLVFLGVYKFYQPPETSTSAKSQPSSTAPSPS